MSSCKTKESRFWESRAGKAIQKGKPKAYVVASALGPLPNVRKTSRALRVIDFLHFQVLLVVLVDALTAFREKDRPRQTVPKFPVISCSC